MVNIQRRHRGIALVALTLALGMLAGCQQYWRDSGVWDIGEHRGLLLDITTYYQRHASEEGGRCHSPILEGVTYADVVDLGDDVLGVHIDYRYRDYLKDGDDCDQRFRPLRCTINRECVGFAARDFRVVETETGFDVIDMSGGRQR